MNKFPLKEVFKIHGGNNGLVERAIYENQADNPEDNIYVFSSATEEAFHLPKVSKHTILKGKQLKSFSKDKKYIIIARNGKAGLMNVIKGVNFAINDHAYIMEVKRNFVDKVNLEYFVMKYQENFLDFVSSKDSNGTFSKEIAENFEIELESIEEQNLCMTSFHKKTQAIEKIKNSIESINEQLKKHVKIKGRKKAYLMSELFKVISGKRIVLKQVYHNPGVLPIVSAQTDNTFWYANKTWLSSLKKNNKGLVFNTPCISWTCVGVNAATLFYRDFEFYLTDNAGVLIPKKENINLKWFIATYQAKIRNLRQGDKDGQSTMFTEHMANIEVEIPVIESGEIDIDIQDKIYAEYKRLSDIKEKLDLIIEK